jgi:hypothetical protein
LIAKAPAKERTEIKNKFNPEHWFLSQVETHIRTQSGAEKTPECVDDAFLKGYADRPTDVSLSDRRVDHVTSCSYCLGRLLQLRATSPARPSRGFRYAAVAAMGLTCLLAGFVVANVWNRKHPAVVEVQSGELHRTLDLSQYGTYRGDQPSSNPPLHLPAALLSLDLILPRLSQPGAYYVIVAADKNGLDRVACAKANAVGADPRTVVTVSLDLRSATPGRYVLLTQLQGEDSPYSYPLQIE